MAWKIKRTLPPSSDRRRIQGKVYWSKDVGWTWKEQADTFPDEYPERVEIEPNALPPSRDKWEWEAVHE